MSTHENVGPDLDKTATHLFVEADGLLQAAVDRASEARSAGSGRSKGYASLTVIAVGLLFQSGGILAVGRLTSAPAKEPLSDSAHFSDSEVGIIRSNLARIDSNVETIQSVKARMAPSMQIDGNISAIRSATQDLQTMVLSEEHVPAKARIE